MMRKKQIYRMLVGALAVCLTAACSNETEVLNGFPTDGNTISVSLRTNDIGAHTRATTASADELSVENLSAYLFAKDGNGEYQLEKVYDNLTWNDDEEPHTVALTGIAERGPKKVYFVANGASIGTLPEGTTEPTLSEEDFQALLMSEMTTNPSTPLPMTAKAELAVWGEEVNNAIIEGEVLLKRISARIDLKVDPQGEGLSFVPTSIALAAAANSYIFPDKGVYNADETVEISGTTLYPYETAAGTVEAVTVTGRVTVGSTEEGVTFTVPFVNGDGEAIAIQRNHHYTVCITKINGFYSAEATVTVSDWSAADGSGDLQAGEDLKMTATEEIEGELATDPIATAIYPDDETKSAVVELIAQDIKTYKIWVGSANIEAITTWSELPQGWKMEEPASTRAEYLWEKSYWTLTIPANESPETKSLTIKAVNKLELAMDEETKKYVQITFEQAGKEEEEVDHSKNPLLKWAKSDLQRSGSGLSVTANFATNHTVTGSYYQFGRNYGFNSVSEATAQYGVERSDMASNRNVYPGTGSTSIVSTYYANGITFRNYPNYFFIDNNHEGDYTSPARAQTWSERAKSNGYDNDYPCPEGWRIPTTDEYLEIMPVTKITGSSAWNTLVQFKTLGNTKCAFRWSKETKEQYSYLKIECLVVNNNTTDATAIDWSDKNVETRYFKGAGYIQAHRNLWEYNGSTHYTARPMEWGSYTGSVQQNSTVLVRLTESYMKYGGFYWTSDATQGVFSIIFNSSTGYELGYYLATYDSPIGANIRCVREQ